ncbi:Ku protein [Streptomyces sp. NPDC050617]|uniref:non-homologous end joining protein Ku n=1 Tax=Streptomyces sp. NPDC050617 TaxID=3154628 RepID=UPI0034409B55
MWKGAIGFGLVSVPVKLYAATEDHGVRLHEVHDKDGGRIRRRSVCSVCGEEVGYEHIAKGYEDDEGRTAILTRDDLADLPLPSKNLIDVLAFVDADRITPLQLARSYYLAPESGAANKPYVLLRETLKKTDRVAVSKITIRTRESLALLRVQDDLMMVHTMYWPDEIRDSAGLAPPDSVTVRPQELKMATSLMDTLSEDFDLDDLEDEYQRALDELVTARLDKKTPAAKTETTAAPDNVIDLMSALQASIDRADKEDKGDREDRASRSGAGGRTARSTAKSAASAKKSAAKKSTAKDGAKSTGTAKSTTKSTAKGTEAKKSTAKKGAAKATKKAAAKKSSRRAS